MAGTFARLARRLSRWAAFLGTVDLRLVVAVAGVASFTLGLFGLRAFLPQQPSSAGYGQSWDDTVFYDLQLYTFAAAPANGAGPFPVTLEIARFLAPLGALLAVLAALRLVLAEQVRRYLAAHASDHAIVVGEGAVALTLARNLGKGTDRDAGEGKQGKGEGKKVVLVSTSDDTITLARRHDILTVRGDSSDRATLSAAGVAGAAELYACTSRGLGNTDIALLAGQLTASRAHPLSAYALIPDAELGVGLRARRIGVSGAPGLRLDFFGLEDGAARKLLACYPLAWDAGDTPHVVIVGFTALGQAVLREVARQQLRHGGPQVKVLLRNAAAAEVSRVTGAFPVIAVACSVSYGELNLPDTAQYTVFICLDDEDDALRASLAIGRLVASDRAHVVTCMRTSAPFAQTLAGNPKFLEDLRGRISVFQVIQEACMPANIRDDAFIEQLARSIHADYVAKSEARGETEAENKSMVPWGKLPKDLRDANVAQAAGIGAKLEAINAVVVPESGEASDFGFTPEEVEGLAELEHKRWMNERTAQGWSYGPKRDNRRKIHPDLQEWDALDEDTREKDRDAVRAIPGILREAGYQILRLPPDSEPRG
jgi:voltage-gated potassium channel Kch